MRSRAAATPVAGDGRDQAHPAAPAACGGERQRAAQVGRGALGRGAEVALGDEDEVGHLHDAGLHELQRVAGAGLDAEQDEVGAVGDLGLGLADADRLDDHPVEAARISTTAGKAGSARPPRRRRAAIERTKTPGRRGRSAIRVRSPSSAPPERRDEGSTAITATVVAAGAEAGEQRVGQRGLSDAGRPGEPEGDAPGRRQAASRSATSAGSSGLVSSAERHRASAALPPAASAAEVARAAASCAAVRLRAAPAAKSVACAAASRAIGTRNGEQET